MSWVDVSFFRSVEIGDGFFAKVRRVELGVVLFSVAIVFVVVVAVVCLECRQELLRLKERVASSRQFVAVADKFSLVAKK